MINQLNSDIRKLLSVKSTYIIGATAMAIVGILAFYFEGYKISADGANRHSNVLADATLDITLFAAIVGVIVTILQMGHEYRYNTITYTLTMSRSRTAVLLSKIVTIAVFAVCYTTFLTLVAWGLIYAGAGLSGDPLPPQDLSFFTNLTKLVIYTVSFSLTALLLVTLTRNMIAAFAILFVVPALTETAAFLILKQNSVYMPFSVLNEIVNPPAGPEAESFGVGDLTPQTAVLLYSSYLLVGWLATWYLFLRRDAT